MSARAILSGVGLLVCGAAVWFAATARRPALTVYCAHDAVYAEAILRQFEETTGMPLNIRYDTEATKSLGLIEQLLRERDSPRCDVFWNNELLGTMDLAERGLLTPYQGTGFARIPATYKDATGRWCGFGARVRVYIINTEALAATPEAVAERMAGDLSRVAMAKPLYGTTLTHYSALWHLLGGAELQRRHQDALARGLQVVNGNATVKALVAQGTCDLGWTDTDDYFAAADAGAPVAMLPIRTDNDAAIVIPNTVAIINGTQRLQQARQLVDFLLSEATEIALSQAARQVPLGPVPAAALAPEVQRMKAWVEDGYPLAEVGPARSECLTWLKSLD